ncbi:DnaD domain protein [Spiroplasma endosymbiont of Notiophilus biguttatus]|uniref:DnaD domain protein n=1 Tax=Spiroplasma endosymbiont of Notiophilus biguttatus TaxID=3066285 RepID=UPI00313CD871
MNRTINDIDIFKLNQSEYINNEDYQILFMLYQPIIGIEAINLYLTLVQEKLLTKRINLDFNHGRIKSLLKITSTQLLVAFQQLESVNLINTYYYSLKSTYIYQLCSPLSADDFFANIHLNSELLKQLGTLNYERQKFYFLKNDIEITENYVNITQQENTIPQSLKLKTALNNIYATQKQISISRPIYSFQNKNQINAMKVNLNSNSNTVISKDNSDFINTTLNLMQQKLPEEYLKNLTGKIPTDKLKTTLEILTNNFQLNNAVINCLIEYVWFKNNKRLEPNYIIKIAETFQENQINSIDDALSHLKLAYARSKKNPQQQFQQESLWSTTEQSTTNNFNKKLIKKYKVDNINKKDITLTQEEINNILKEFDAH